MEKRTPEKFLSEEGMTIDTAKRIYLNILGFINRHQHIGCLSEISTAMLIQEIITNRTNHAGYTSAIQLLKDIGEDRDYIKLDTCDTEHCDGVNCLYREECILYKNTIKKEGLYE